MNDYDGNRDIRDEHAEAPAEYHYTKPDAGRSFDADASDRGSAPYGTYNSPYVSGSAPVYSQRFGGNEPKKRSSDTRKGRGILTVVLCCVLSACCGFGGAWAYGRFFGSSGGSVIYESVEHGSSDAGIGNISTLADVADLCKPSVVEITTEVVSTGSFFGQSISEGAGSGVVLTADGYIVTNYHVISGARTVTVTMANGDKYPATVYGTDADNDLAVLKIAATGLSPATLGDSTELRVGDSVIAIGNPLGSLGGTVTEGIVSALDREIQVEGKTMVLLQTSAAVNPGNSGGGLFNTYGELIGIVNAKSSGTDVEGLGFAISSSIVKEVVAEIMEQGGEVKAPAIVLGISVIDIKDTQTAAQYRVSRLGVYIASITPGYGAERAGLKSGDYIVSVGNVAIEETDDLTALLKEYKAGDVVSVQIIRDNRTMSFDVELMDTSAAAA